MADIFNDYFKLSAVAADTFTLFCGNQLGSGVSRSVYEYTLDSSLVIKFEHANRSFSNAMEWEIWQDVKEMKKARKWLAPCVQISGCGIVLIQKRTQPLPKDFDLKSECPKGIPDWLTDVKRSNWGLLDGKLVCHDYGLHLCVANATHKQKLVKKSFWT